MSKTQAKPKEWCFVACQRADGSVYGTAGQCRKGKEISLRSELKKLLGKERKTELTDDEVRWLEKSHLAIGKGASAQVYDAGDNVVLKIGTVDDEEIDVMEELAHIDGVPRLLAQNFNDDVAVLAMSKSPGQTLQDLAQKGDRESIMEGLNASVSILREIHKTGISHNDIHDGNIMYDRETKQATIIDFGLSYKDPISAVFELRQFGTRLSIAISEFKDNPKPPTHADALKFVKAVEKAKSKHRKVFNGSRKDISDSKAKKVVEDIWSEYDKPFSS